MRLPICTVVLLIGVFTACGGTADERRFDSVANLFEKRCVSCHNASEAKGGFAIDSRDAFRAGGESGETIVAGRPDKSLLIEMISGEEPEMPKGADNLSADEIEVIRQWITTGAEWPEGRKLKDGSLADKDWWSLRLLSAVALPASDREIVANPIDLFIEAKLRERRLKASPPADRRTLIRRVAFDLTGLPPTADEVDAFCVDDDPSAYLKLVDRLLDSPRYGERWARHWLDVVHYGETHGYDKDKPRPNAWPYRDYVIRAFNEDKPYNRFIQEQIAGDILFPESIDGVVALGFIAAGPWDFIGHAEVPESKTDGKIARHLDRDDMISNAISTFQSVTVHCAQCHNHKFDSIPQEDYFALQANFAALDRADRKYFADAVTTRRFHELDSRQQTLAERKKAIEKEAAGEELKAIDKKITDAAKKPVATKPEFGYHSAVSLTQDAIKWVQIDLGRSEVVDQVVLKPTHDTFNNIGAGFGFPLRYRIEISDDPEFKTNNSTVVSNEESDVPSPGTKPQTFAANDSTGRFVRVTATKLAPRKGDFIFALAEMQVITASGENIAAGAVVTALDSIELLPRWSKKNLVDAIAPEQDSELTELRSQRADLLKRTMTEEQRVEFKAIDRELTDLKKELSSFPSPDIVYAGTVYTGSGNFMGTGANGGKPRPIHVLARGDVTRPVKEVTPGALSCLSSLPARFELPADASEGERRAAFARWLSDEKNPLTWRSIVNRVWQFHFGRGIVETPNDFGRMGASPTHPELLDCLALWFRDEAQGSLKKLHKLIVTSETYRQTSSPDIVQTANAMEIDSSNELLWRQNRRKLEAEAIRDSILLAAGKLDLTMGGPSFQDFVITHPEHSPHYEYHLADPEDTKIHRRSIYRFIVRSQQQPWMSTMDCADPSMLVDKRNQTITPLQALAQLNNDLSIAMAMHFSTRVLNVSNSVDEQIDAAFQIALQRTPTGVEREETVRFAKEHGLANACRLIMNLNEFVFVD